MAKRTLEVVITGNERDAKRAFASLEHSSNSLGSKLASVGSKIAGVMAAAGAAGAALAGWGLKSAADMQQVEIAFTGILGSGEKAADFLTKLRDFAAKTPFEFPELARSAKMLLATGFAADDVLPIMTKLGNVAATLGVGGAEIEGVVRALGQMKGKGKASAEELQQISEQIPGFSAIQAIADDMGVTVAEAFDKMSTGAIGADQAIQAIFKGMEKFPGAAGAMERQSQTLSGVLSTLKDTARDALVKGLAPILPTLSAAIQKAMPQIQSGLTGLGVTFGKLFTTVTPLLVQLLPVISQLAQAGAGLGLSLATALLPIIVALTPPLVDLTNALARVIDWLGPSGVAAVLAGIAFFRMANTIKDGMHIVSTAMSTNPWAIAAAAVAAAVVLIIANWEDVKFYLLKAWEWIEDAARSFANTIRSIWNSIPFLPDKRMLVDTNGVIQYSGPIGPPLPGTDTVGGVPMGAKGAIVSRPTLALIGEAGTEAVMPLDRMPGAYPLPWSAGGADRSLVVQLVVDGKVLAEVVRPYALADQRAGRSWAVA